MRTCILKIFYAIFIQQCIILDINAYQQNKTNHHSRRISKYYDFMKVLKSSFPPNEPMPLKPHRSYEGPVGITDYDISYDTEYGGVVSNFTYEDNPPLYPNPELLSKSQVISKIADVKLAETDVELPDDSLADADLKEHDVIDSVTYLYGINNCYGGGNQWKHTLYLASILALFMLTFVILWLLCGKVTADFRRNSMLYPININLCCCLGVCTFIYIAAITGVSSSYQCERIALILHYTHISCAMWIVALAAAVAEYCVCDSLIPLKYNYLLAYGVPAVVVMFNYALSMEHYEIKRYCWMSIEKGMVMGFMVPIMILILINTAIVILGLQSVNRKQAEILTAKIQELVDGHVTNWPKNEQNGDKNASIDTLDIYTPGSSRKNTDSSETLDKECNMGDDCQYANVAAQNDGNVENGNEKNIQAKTIQETNIINMLYIDSMTGKWSWNTEGNDLKAYLYLCLVMEPVFAIYWVMGVLAVENTRHWPTPIFYLILVVCMFLYMLGTICAHLPIIRQKSSTVPCCESVITEQSLSRTRTTDNIPLLDPSVQQSNVSSAPADTISTISI